MRNFLKNVQKSIQFQTEKKNINWQWWERKIWQWSFIQLSLVLVIETLHKKYSETKIHFLTKDEFQSLTKTFQSPPNIM